MAKSKVSKFKVKSPSNLIQYLNKFKAIEKSLLLELTEDGLVSKSYTPDQSTVKGSKISLRDVLEGTVPVPIIKIGISDISKLTGLFKHFSEGDEIFMDLSYADLGDDEIVATELKFYTSSLKINFVCADLSLFNYIEDEMLSKIVDSAIDEKITEFPFPKDAFSKIVSLCNIDSTDDLLNISISNSKIIFKSKSFELTVSDAPSNIDADFSFFNYQFGFIDQEISTFHIGNDKMIVKSQESDSVIIIGRVE